MRMPAKLDPLNPAKDFLSVKAGEWKALAWGKDTLSVPKTTSVPLGLPVPVGLAPNFAVTFEFLPLSFPACQT